MRLRQRVPKASGGGGHREVTADVTLARMGPQLRRVGITRIADITGLDRVRIPVYNSICPRSSDVLSVYNGKGVTPLDAKASAIMEAVERFSAALPAAPATIASYPELVDRGCAALDPREVNLELFRGYRLEMPISWVEGHDLINDRAVLVPMYLARYHMYFHETPCYSITTTNGIASGNSIEEAVCHALAEVIERDDWTLADLVGNRLRQVVVGDSLIPGGLDGAAAWLQDLHRSIEVDSLPPLPLRLVEMFSAAGVSLELKNITSRSGIPTVLATASEEIASTFSHSHRGLGTHPDAEVAVTRALVEVAQSRAVDISAVREDITLPDQQTPRSSLHSKRTDSSSRATWALTPSSTPVRLADLPSVQTDDVVADIQLMLDRLRASGLSQAIVVDLSPPDVPAAVVRVVVPGAESWVVDRSRLGARAKATMDEALAALFPETPPPSRTS